MPPLAAAQEPLGASLATDNLARQAVYHGWSGCPGHGVGPFSVVGRGFRFASEPDPPPGPHWAVGAAPQHTSHRYAPKPELLRLNHVSASTFKRNFDVPRFLPHVAREGN